MTETEMTETPDFNFALMYLTHLHNLMVSTSTCMLKKDVEGWYTILRAVYTLTCYYFKNDKSAEIKKEFADIEGLIYDPAVTNFRLNPNTAPLEQKKAFKEKTALALEKLFTLQEDLLKVLFACGLIMPHTKINKTLESLTRGIKK